MLSLMKYVLSQKYCVLVATLIMKLSKIPVKPTNPVDRMEA